MRFLKAVTIGMGVLIVVGTTVLVVLISRRLDGPAPPVAGSVAVVLDEPAGTRIAGIASVRDWLAVQLQGGGADRVVFVDPRSGVVTGRVGLRQSEP